MNNDLIVPTPAVEPVFVAGEVFISYSRRDKEFVASIIPLLEAKGFKVWIDTDRILPASIWTSSIRSAIDNCAAVVFLVTEASLQSIECKKELDYALQHGKKIIPLIIDGLDGLIIPEPLSAIHAIVCNTKSDDRIVADRLLAAIKLDLDWYHWHASTLEQAQYWLKQSKNKHLLLRGSELQTAEAWLDKNKHNKYGVVSEVQFEYVKASRLGAAKRMLGVALPVFALTLLLSATLSVIGNSLMLPGVSPRGMVDLDFASSIHQEKRIVQAWTPDLVIHAVVSICIDFFFILSYVLSLALLAVYNIIALKKKARFLSVLGFGVFVALLLAGAADVAINFSVLPLLLGGEALISAGTRIIFKSYKFAAVMLTVFYILIGLILSLKSAMQRKQKVF